MMELLAMGKYGVYVWTSFSLTLFVMIACSVQAWSRHRKIYEQIQSRLNAADSVT